jgi:hypothetical protein
LSTIEEVKRGTKPLADRLRLALELLEREGRVVGRRHRVPNEKVVDGKRVLGPPVRPEYPNGIRVFESILLAEHEGLAEQAADDRRCAVDARIIDEVWVLTAQGNARLREIHVVGS